MTAKCEEVLPFHDISSLSNSQPPSSPTPSSIVTDSPYDLKILSTPGVYSQNWLALCSSECYDAVVVTETWLNSDIQDSELYIQGYTLLRNDRNRHGGVCIYLAFHLSFRCVSHHPDLEMIKTEISVRTDTVTLLGIYRPPSVNTSVIESLHHFISDVKPKNLSNLIICGDFNIDPNVPSVSLQSALTQLMLDFNLTLSQNPPE